MKGRNASRNIIVPAVACAFALIAPATTPAFAAPGGEPAARASLSSQIDSLKAQIQALKAQKAHDGASGEAIDTRIAKLEEQLDKLEAAQKARAGAAGPVVENGGVATRTTINRDELQSSNAQNTYDAIKNVPGVGQADAKAGGGSDNLQIRGIHLGSNTGYRLDGWMPMVNDVIMSPEDKERVQVLKGAGALEFGLASPAGIINYSLKRATKSPIDEVSFSGNEFGQGTAAVDIGRKFGFRNQFGFRVNVAGGETGGYVRDTGGTRWLGAVTTDWTTDKARVQLGFEKYGINVVEQAALLQNKPDASGHIALPKIPDPTNLLSGDWDRGTGGGQNATMRTDYRLSDAVSVVAELGRSDTDRPHRIVTKISNYNIATGKGTETATLIEDQRYTDTYANLAATFRAQHGDAFANAFTLGWTRSERDFNNPTTQQATFKQNIYNPVLEPAPQFSPGPVQYQPQNSKDYDYFFTDSLVLAQRVHLTGGLREIHYTADDTLPTGKNNHSTTSFLAPAVGGVFDFTRNVSLYASYVKSLEETAQAPINAKNAFAMLPPAPATQKEVGFRAVGSNGFSATLAYFTVNRANTTIDPVTNIYGLNGTNTFSGVETTLNARIAPRLSLAFGGQLENATEHSPDDPTIDGKIPENTPKLSGSLGLTYQAPFAPGLQLTGGVQYVGLRQINPQDQGTIPAVTLANVGLAYTKTINGRRVTFNLNCKNCTDKRYWSSAVNSALGVGAPRTLSFSVRFAGLP